MQSTVFPLNSSDFPGDTCASKSTGKNNIFNDACASFIDTRSFRSRYKQGAEIAVQGEKLDRVGLITSGLVKIALITIDGHEHVLQVLRRGQIVGDLFSTQNAFSWEAATETEICWLARRTLLDFLQENPMSYRTFLAIVLQQLEEHRLWVAALRGRSTVQRLAYWLVQQVTGECAAANPVVMISLARRDLASLLDMTVETLCRGFHQLSERGAISLLAPDLIEISNAEKLRFYARCADVGPGTRLRVGKAA